MIHWSTSFLLPIFFCEAYLIIYTLRSRFVRRPVELFFILVAWWSRVPQHVWQCYVYLSAYTKTDLYDIWFGRLFFFASFWIIDCIYKAFGFVHSTCCTGSNQRPKTNFCASLKRLAKVSRPHSKQCCFMYSTIHCKQLSSRHELS